MRLRCTASRAMSESPQQCTAERKAAVHRRASNEQRFRAMHRMVRAKRWHAKHRQREMPRNALKMLRFCDAAKHFRASLGSDAPSEGFCSRDAPPCGSLAPMRVVGPHAGQLPPSAGRVPSCGSCALVRVVHPQAECNEVPITVVHSGNFNTLP